MQLHCVGRHRETISWMVDWKQRKGTAPWMLVNLAGSYRSLGLDDAAHAVHEYAEALPVNGYEKPRTIHRLWLAADSLRRGDAATAMGLLDKTKMATVDRDYQFLRKVIDAMLMAVLRQQPGGFASSKAKLAEARKIHGNFGNDRELKPIYLQALKVIASRWGGPKAHWWCFWHGLAVRTGGVGKQKSSK